MTFVRLTKEQAKEEIRLLVNKYNRIVAENKFKSYNEEMTKKGFILPLFRALGWDVEDEDEVSAEEKISKGRVDYGFRLDGIPKFFLEAKSLKEDLNNPKFIQQAIDYSWHKGCTWAVLTDFEAIKIFNAEWKSANPLQAQFGQTLPCQLFLEKFDTLWLLSRESFENKFIKLVDKEIELRKRLVELKDKTTDEKVRLEKEIQRIDDEIDQEVYKLYGITKEEQKIIEGGLK